MVLDRFRAKAGPCQGRQGILRPRAMDQGRLPCFSIQVSQIHLFTRFRTILAWANRPPTRLFRGNRAQEL